MRDDLKVGETAVFTWGVTEVAGTVAEIYGRTGQRQVVLALDPEESGYVVDEPTTVSLPLEAVRRLVDR